MRSRFWNSCFSFGGERLTVDLVQSQLGIASDERTLDLLDALSRREPAQAITIVEQTAMAGVQPTELLAGAIDFLRDTMMVAVRAERSPARGDSRGRKPRLQAIADRWPPETLLAALQILAEVPRAPPREPARARSGRDRPATRRQRSTTSTELGDVVARLLALETGAPAVAPLEKKKLSLADRGPRGSRPSPQPRSLQRHLPLPPRPRPLPPQSQCLQWLPRPLGRERPMIAAVWELSRDPGPLEPTGHCNPGARDLASKLARRSRPIEARRGAMSSLLSRFGRIQLAGRRLRAG